MKKNLSVAHAFCFSDAAYSQKAINKDVSKANLYTTSENSYIGKSFFHFTLQIMYGNLS
ncbi:hypothetical protein [Chryseobacterium sp. sg2396]|uniref:hypothetical protein n=1 Tax=Chryseobacterium sp. sg2396 TaxID=3276280 RepID=UPI0025F42266|nr:hypothetical protein [uncultured Chryseobacterium sp.]